MNPAHGGPAQGIRNSIPALQQLGESHEVLCMDDPAANYIQQQDFPIHAVGAAKGPWAYHKQLAPWLQKNIADFDIVIVHGLWLYHGQAVRKVVKQKKRTGIACPKLYVMPHGMLDPYFQKASDRKLKALRNNLYWKILENKLINESDGILFTCEEELRLARMAFPNYQPKLELNIGYGVPAPPIYSESMADAFNRSVPQLNKRPYILFLSRIHPKKGVDILLQAYKIVCEEMHGVVDMPDLVIAGPGMDSSFGKMLLQMVSNSSELQTRVHFTGMLQGAAKWGALYGCDAFVLPSHQENFGIAVVEALACGKPVLISNQVNIWQEIKAGGAGLIAVDDLKETKLQLMNWLSMPAKVKVAMGHAAKATFEKKFTMNAAAKQMITALHANGHDY